MFIRDHFYRMLMLSPEEEFDIRRATKNYHLVVRRIHPDKCSSPMSHEATVWLVEAMRVLSDEILRGQYHLYGLFMSDRYDAAVFDEVVAFIEGIMTASRSPAPASKTDDINDDLPERSDSAFDEPRPSSSASSGTGAADDPIVVDDTVDAQPSEECPANEPSQSRATSGEDDNAASGSDRTFQDEAASDVPQPGASGSSSSSRTRRERSDEELNRSGDQAEPSNRSFNDTASDANSFRASIKEIKTHRIRRGVIKFKVVWNPYGVEVWEPADVVIEDKDSLSEYLHSLRRSRSRSFIHLLKTFPFITQFLD